MKKGGLESRSLWLSILSEKGLEKEFSKQALMDIHEYENKPKKSIVDYLSLLLLQQQYYYHFTNNSAEDGIIQIQKTVEALNAYVQVLKLRMLCEVRHLKTVLPDECLIAHLIETLNTHNFSNVIDSPLPTLYNELRLLLETNDFKQFDKFTSLISKNAQKINAKELDEFLLFINSFLSTISRKSQTSEEMDKTHELNKIALRNKIFFLQGTMRVAHFLNIVTAACKVKDFKWAVHFAASCKYLLPASDREDAFALAMGITHFEKKEYHLLYDLVKNIESKEIYIQIRVRSFLVVCHYELDTDMDLKEYSMNFKAYLKRNLKLKPYKETVRSILNMVDIVKLLILENTPKQQIEDQINSCGSLTFKEWLIDKVKKYKKR